MAKAVICPVCSDDGEAHNSPSPHLIFEKCNGCGGRGWVEVSDNGNPWLPLPSMPNCIRTGPLQVHYSTMLRFDNGYFT